MAEEKSKPVGKPSDQGTIKPSEGERTNLGTPIGDSNKSIEQLRKAMEIPPKTNTGSDDKK